MGMSPSNAFCCGTLGRLRRRRSRPCYSLTGECSMAKPYTFVLASLVLTLTPVTCMGQTFDGPETVVVHNGPVTLHAMVWRPHGSGPFPAILLNHGSGRSCESIHMKFSNLE